MTRCVIDAIVQSGVYAILSKGWSDRLQVKSVGEVAEPEVPLPKEIFSISSIPHDWLFKRVDAACHHGGAGTTGASVRGKSFSLRLYFALLPFHLAGIPTIIKPFFGDQHFWADRVEALGIGSAVRKLTVQNLCDALVAATTDQKQIQRAARVGEQVRMVSRQVPSYTGHADPLIPTGKRCSERHRIHLPRYGIRPLIDSQAPCGPHPGSQGRR